MLDMITRNIAVLVASAFVLGQVGVVRAADANPPEMMTYQGYLVDGNGAALGNSAPTNYDVVFRIYKAKQGGTAIWAEHQTVTVDKGYFSLLLGEGAGTASGEPSDDLSAAFDGTDASDRYIGITVSGLGGADVEIAPRLRLVASPYAFTASQARRLTDGSGNKNFFKEGSTLKLGAGETPTLMLPEAGGATLSGKLTAHLDGLGWGVQIDNGTLTTTFGANNASFFDFNTQSPGFRFDKAIYVKGHILSYNEDTVIGPSNDPDTYLKVGESSKKITAQADEFQVQGGSNYLLTKFTSDKVELHTDADSFYINKPLDVNGRIQDKTGFVSPVGSVIAFAGSTAPDGWLLCDGSNYSSANFPDLHAVIGTSFGSTGGNFHVPDLRTRVPVGLSSSNTQFQEIGDVGGAAEHTLSVGEMPSHQHDVARRDIDDRGMGWASVQANGQNGMVSSYSYGSDNNTYHPSDSDAYHAKPTGADSSHNNMPPFVVMNYIIKY